MKQNIKSIIENIFHECIWQEIERTYVPPHNFPGINEASGRVANELARQLSIAVNGMTTILWECKVCKKLRKEEMLGKSIDRS